MGRKSKVSSKVKEGCILTELFHPDEWPYGVLLTSKKVWYLISISWDISGSLESIEEDCPIITNIFCHSRLSRRRNNRLL